MWITRVTALATIANVMASYLAFFWAPAATGAPHALVVCVALAALAVLNVAGVRWVARATNGLTIAKLVPLVLFVAVGLFALDPRAFVAGPWPPAASFSQAMFQLVFAFAGFEATVVVAGEGRDPRRDVPFALMLAIGLSTVFYVLIQVVCIGTLPGLAGSEKPLADAGARVLGAAGGGLIAFGALLSTVGTLCGSLLIGSRLLFAMSEQDQLPGVLNRVHPRFRTPHVAVLITFGAGLALVLTGTFTYVLGINVLTRLATYALTAGALIAFRRRPIAPAAGFRAPGGVALAILAIATCVWLGSRSGMRELRDLGLACVAGALIFAAHRWSARPRA
jgi:amino acid transporter